MPDKVATSAAPAAAPSESPSATVRRAPLAAPARNTVADTWRWLWKDTAGRLLPFAAAAAAYAHFSGQGARGVGLTREGLVRDLLVGNAIGVPAAVVAAGFRRWVAPGYRLPTPADQALQTAFYFALNAPVEEVFWRGTVQQLAIAGLRQVPGLRRVAAVLGWGATTAAFGAYHRLGGWSWRSIAGVTVAGGLFGALYLRARRRSLLPAIIVHGYMTAGFLSWGDLALHGLRSLRAFTGAAR
jgi:membrane protease YdiL (CAAX protease family)